MNDKYEKHLRNLIAYYREEYTPSDEVEDFVEGVSVEQAAELCGKPELLEELYAALAAYGEEMEEINPYDEHVAGMTEEQQMYFGL